MGCMTFSLKSHNLSRIAIAPNNFQVKQKLTPLLIMGGALTLIE